ncbi:MAG: MmcQ/YjbR family DNA-binding protein [Proteobacteria bacterium]|nr:MmcQ/YjbR family DNA-binding protein [Pseudomonadota bacterium]
MPSEKAITAPDINRAVRNVCLWLPEAEEIPSRGSPDFRVDGKTFASYIVNHHGDGRISLWLRSPAGAQDLYTREEPEHYFVPPYVGPKGWLGVNLDTGLKWDTIALRVREAYEEVASATLRREIGKTPKFAKPATTMAPADFDPMNRPRAQKVLMQVSQICLALPEVTQGSQFGDPIFRAGKKGFCQLHSRDRRVRMQTWVGPEMQSMLTVEKRFIVPAYTGHNGWIELDLESRADWDEVRGLILSSYRHFALKRMLNALPEDV